MAIRPVVVGADGSEESLLAVEWAAIEARRHGLPLRIVSVPTMLPRMRAYEVSPPMVADARRDAAARVLQGHPARVLAN